MSHQYYPIVGIKDGWEGNGKVPVRRDFDEWTTSEDPIDKTQVILYLLALQEFQAVDPKSRDSYFQIAGIHGYPYEPWDEPSTTQREIGRKGYCVHANNLFPPWHRPYMLLYEQRLYELMRDVVIPKYPSYKAEYLKVASTWRLPYWDWAKNPRVPALARYRRIKITFGGEPEKEIANPLYQFRMPNDEKMKTYGVGSIVNFDGGEPFDYGECIATSRCPKEEEIADEKKWLYGVVNDKKVDEFMAVHSAVTDTSYGSAAEMVYRLLTYPMDYPHFATLARDETMVSVGASTSSVTNDINMEFIHNNIHYWVGGDGGHMSQIPVATFDPTFWLHHCNIDRIFAIWQSLNPDKWFDADSQRYFDQKIVGSGTVITNKTPLRPFHKDTEGTVWTPDDTRDWFALGYTYPELRDRKPDSTKLLKMINEYYGMTRKEALALAKGTEKVPGVEVLDEKTKTYDYALSIKYSKFALGGSPFNIEVYLHPEGKTEDTFTIEEFVTNVYNFSQTPDNADGEEVCSNCREGQDRNVQATAYIPLTSYMIRMFKEKQIDSLEPAVVEKVLARMYWRVVNIAGKPIAEDRWKDTMNLNISVSKTTMTYTEDPGDKPEFDEPEVVPNLGTGMSAAQPAQQGVTGNDITVGKITQLEDPVPVGGSIIFKSPSMNLVKPPRDEGTGIALMHWPADRAGGDPLDSESYNVLMSMVIKNYRGLVQCNYKPVGQGYNLISDFTPDPWFSETPQLRVDVKEGEFDIYVDGKKAFTYKRNVKEDVTHVHYYTMSRRSEPVMARVITANVYRDTGDVR